MRIRIDKITDSRPYVKTNLFEISNPSGMGAIGKERRGDDLGLRSSPVMGYMKGGGVKSL